LITIGGTIVFRGEFLNRKKLKLKTENEKIKTTIQNLKRLALLLYPALGGS
jgi:hypothetical protein